MVWSHSDVNCERAAFISIWTYSWKHSLSLSKAYREKLKCVVLSFAAWPTRHDTVCFLIKTCNKKRKMICVSKTWQGVIWAFAFPNGYYKKRKVFTGGVTDGCHYMICADKPHFSTHKICCRDVAINAFEVANLWLRSIVKKLRHF